MFDFSETQFQNLAIHRVGSSAREDELELASQLTAIDDQDTLNFLSTYFLAPFKHPQFYSFHHADGVAQNPVYPMVAKVFEDSESLLDASVSIANQLYSSSNHPNIKFGELYVVLLSGCIVDGEQVDALGIFKSESREPFMRVYPQGGAYGVEAQEGISINKLDKGCLVFNTEKELGYKVVAVDRTNSGEEAKFWKNDFLAIKPREDDFYQTSGYLSLCKEFVQEVVVPEGKHDRADQVMMLNSSKDFFTKNDSFSQDDFEQQVIREPEMIESFREYKDSYQAEKGCNLKDSFTISVDAAKDAKKMFKSVIKLDKNFHVYIHGGRDRVNKGFDADRGLNYYTLYFDAEG